MVQSFTDYLFTAFIQRGFKVEDVPKRRLDELQLWNSFSYYPAVTCWDILDGQAGKYIGKDKKWHPGKYLFTVDFAHPESNILDTDHSEIPHEHKCAHIIALDDGNYADSQTIDVYGIYHHLRLKMIFLNGRCKQMNGM